MAKTVRIIFAALAAIALFATLISLIPSDQWFIRVIDLVREPFAYVAILLAVLAALFVRQWRWLIAGAFLAVALVHAWRIWPYNPLAGNEVAFYKPKGNDRCFTALAVNVKVKNTDFQGVIDQIDAVDPDVLLLMETDQKWADALAPTLGRYRHTLSEIQPEAFGMIFASRLPVRSSQMLENTHRDTPTLYATIEIPGTSAFEFIGLHPKPPLPGWDTDERDSNIVDAGAKTPDDLPNALVMGDFNDVPWSRTTTAFREGGDWLDPRIGRGTYPTFPANLLVAGWPLDQVMYKGNMGLRGFEVMPDNGSDHRAMRARLCARGAI